MRRSKGFTLIELVVAMAIFFIMGTMLYAGLDGIRRQTVFSEEAEAALREIHYAMRRLSADVSQMQPRPIRDEVGDGWRPALAAGDSYAIEFTRGGWRNPLAQPRGTLQRVAYTIDGDVLVRLHWPVLDRTLSTEPLRTEVLSGVREMRVRYLDSTGQWHEQWPPLNVFEAPLRMRPLALEVLFDLDEWGQISRIIEIGG